MADEFIEKLKDMFKDSHLEIEDQGNSQFIFVNKTSGKEPQDLGDIVDWHSKFDRQNKGRDPAFESGEILMVNGIVEPDKGGYKIHVDCDGRVADNFYVKSDKLNDYSGMPLDVLLMVGEERKADWRISNIYNYDAEFITIWKKPLVNPSVSEIQDLNPGDRVIIKGEYVGRVERGEEYGRMKYTGMFKVGGVVYPVLFDSNELELSDGVLENLNRKKVMDGDFVRVAPMKTKSGELFMWPNDPCVLDKPCDERLTEYNELRIHVYDQIEKIKNNYTRSKKKRIVQKKGKIIRNIIADLRSLDLTKDEFSQVKELTENMGDNVKPAFNSEDRKDFDTKAIDEMYHVRLESMTEDQFINFYRKVCTGEVSKKGKKADDSYLHRISEDFGLSEDQRTDILIECIDNRLGKIIDRAYDHNRDFQNEYMFDQSLKYLAAIGNKKATEKLVGLYQQFFIDGEFHEIGFRDHEDTWKSYLNEVASSMEFHDEDLDFEVLKSNEKCFRIAADYLEKHADDHFALEYTKNLIEYIENKE